MENKKKTLKEFILFILGALIGSGVMFGVYYLLLALGVPYAWSYAAGFAASIVANFFVNKYIVFRASQQSGKQAAGSFAKTAAVYGVAFVMSELLLRLFVETAGMSDKIAPLLAAFLTTPVNYLLNKFWAFKK